MTKDISFFYTNVWVSSRNDSQWFTAMALCIHQIITLLHGEEGVATAGSCGMYIFC